MEFERFKNKQNERNGKNRMMKNPQKWAKLNGENLTEVGRKWRKIEKNGQNKVMRFRQKPAK